MRAWLGISWYWGGVIVLALGTIALGYWGWTIDHAGEPLHNVLRTAQLILGQAATASETNWQVPVAGVLAPIVMAAAAIRVGFDLLGDRYQRWRIGRAHKHTLVCGGGERARAFAQNEAAHGRKAIMIIPAPTESDEGFCETHRIRMLRGDARDAETLSAAAVERANRLIAITGDDAANLQIAMTAREVLNTTPPHNPDLRAFAALDDRNLWNDLSRSDSIARRSNNFEFGMFSLSELVARRFFWDVPLYRYADLRDQPRIHAVFLGLGHYGEGLLLQMLRACGYRHFDKPVATVLCANANAEEDRLRRHCPEIDKVVQLVAHSIDVASRPIDQVVMSKVEKHSPVTAVFVCLDSDEATLQASIYVREIMRRTGLWNAPVYARIGGDPGLEDLVSLSDTSRHFEDIIQVFGSDAENCDFEIVDGGLEKTARKIHEAYRDTRRERLAGDSTAERQESLQRWENLRETYRESNRRAADHIKAKLESAGCHVPRGLELVAPTGFHLPREHAAREELAELEHRSWCTGMQLDGWRYALRRNNRRREHDNLVEYDALHESLKDYDRDQIDLIDNVFVERRDLDPGTPAIRRDHWIGLIGRIRVQADEAEWASRVLTEQVLDRLSARYTDAHFTLVTPLAPGLDLVLTRAALEWFADHGLAHRLLVVKGVSSDAMLDDFRDAFEAGSAWNGQPRGTDGQWIDTGSNCRTGRAAIAAARDSVLGSHACEWIIDLTDAAADYEQVAERRLGYRRAGDYIAQRSHTLVAATLHDAAMRPGGVMETLERRSAALAARHASWPATMSCSTVLLEIDKRDVRVRESRTNEAGGTT